MKLFGVQVPFTGGKQKALSSVNQSSGGWYRIFESFSGAWQGNVEVDRDSVLTYYAVYACMTLIASDIAKLRLKLVEKGRDGVWQEVTNPAYSPVLRKPNPYQTRIQFFENWVLSRLSDGNAYILKERDARGVVVGLRVLDPRRVTPMVADNGDVYYKLNSDNLAGLQAADIMVPASEIIHSRGACIYHPLVGVSPIVAAGAAAMQGLNIQSNSTNFFGNSSMPGGILTAPGAISEDTATRLRDTWNTKFTGDNAGKIAVLGDGLQFERLSVTAKDAELVGQLKWTAEVVCSVFHVPPYKIGIGEPPKYNNVQALNVEYYTQALQRIIEDIELELDEGLGMATRPGAKQIGTEFDIDGLLRMDSNSMIEVLKEAVGAGIMSINEGRQKLDLKPVEGGNSPFLQQQNWSIEDLARRSELGMAPDQVEMPELEPQPSEARFMDALRIKYLEALNG